LILNLGGAERLVVDAALGLQNLGHNVEFFTSHHSIEHCFEETKNGTLQVNVYGDFLPRNIFGYFHVLFAIIRMVRIVPFKPDLCLVDCMLFSSKI
jgi:alpha-1,3/alpha-1,6-mannosyltransferase